MPSILETRRPALPPRPRSDTGPLPPGGGCGANGRSRRRRRRRSCGGRPRRISWLQLSQASKSSTRFGSKVNQSGSLKGKGRSHSIAVCRSLIGWENFCRLESIKHPGERRGANGVLLLMLLSPLRSPPPHPSSPSLRGDGSAAPRGGHS